MADLQDPCAPRGPEWYRRHPLLAARLEWEREHPRPESLRNVERMIVRGLNEYGFGRQYQVTREDGFEIAVDDLVVTVKRVEG